MLPEKVYLSEADWLEFVPVIWRPSTGDERLAALVGYCTGDGNLSKSVRRYTKKDGSVSIYSRMQGALYSNFEGDLKRMLEDCHALGMALEASVRLKKGKSDNPGYQVRLGDADARELAEAGAPVGKKVDLEFEVPRWVREGSAGVKRAYIGALFGAEGSTPVKDKSGKSRFPRQPVLSMCKRAPKSAQRFFEQLQRLLADLGVEATITVTGSTYRTYWLRIKSGPENLIRFFEEVGYIYCDSKSVLAWQWAKYLRAYQVEAKRRRDTALRMHEDGETYELIGRSLGITKGAAHRLVKDLKAGRDCTAGHGFPHFERWIGERWNDELGLLRLEVVGRSFRSKREEVWNLTVSSPDHSYLLASGANNFNSFETMSGRVYHPFDRNVHVGDYPFNPRLPIWIGQDFNIDPMSSVILQPQDNGEVWAVGELVLFGSNTEEVCDELERRYWRHMKQITVYPDPAGGARQHARGETDLDIFRDKGFKRIKHRRKHPRIADRVNAVNRMLRSADGTVRLRVDKGCRSLIESLEQTIYKKGSRDIDKSMGVEHITDALGYVIELEFPVRKVQVAGVSL